jgi:hypothetical protein
VLSLWRVGAEQSGAARNGLRAQHLDNALTECLKWGRVNLCCHGYARASFSLTLRAGAMLMRLDRIGRLGGAAAAGGGRDALSYGVSFATTRSHQLARGVSGVLSLWRVGAEQSGAARNKAIANQSPLRRLSLRRVRYSKERLRVSNWIVQRLYNYAVKKTVEL